MSVVDLPCEYEEWWDYQKMFILLSHVRSIKDLNLLISSHTRDDLRGSPSANFLTSLKGLVAFFSEYCTLEEQKKYVSETLPFIAKAASLLEERVPLSGIPCLQKQENAALVLGRKVILSILANAFLCSFPPQRGDGDTTFSFKKFFAIFESKDAGKKKMQAEKLRCILSYFYRAASDRCNLSGVITYRRQVLAYKELPQITEWEHNSFPLCPFEVDDKNLIDESGGHTLQVSFTSNVLGGGVLGEGCGEGEIPFCVCPELLVARLIMEPMDENETVIVTGSEKFSSYSGKASTFMFAGEYTDSSERDVFGNLLKSLLILDAAPQHPCTQQHPQPDQYQADSMLRELNKAYVGFHCQQDRGDISTELLALSVKRGSLAFVAEDYPNCGAPFHITSCQSDIGNVHLTSESTSSETDLKVSVTPAAVEPSGASSPLSPIPEISESPSFTTLLANDIIKSGLRAMEYSEIRHAVKTQPRRGPGGIEEETAAKLVQAILKESIDLFAVETDSGVDVSPSTDDLVTSLTASILNASFQTHAQTTAARSAVKATSEFDAKSTSLVRSIIDDVLRSCPPPVQPKKTPQTLGECTSSDGLSSMAAKLSGSIMSDVLQNCAMVAPFPVSIQVRAPSLTGADVAQQEYINKMMNNAIQEGISVAQVKTLKSQSQRPQADADHFYANVSVLAKNIVDKSIRNSVRRVQAKADEQEDQHGRETRSVQTTSLPNLKKQQPPVHRGLPLGTPPGGGSTLRGLPPGTSPGGGSSLRGLPPAATTTGDQNPQQDPPPSETMTEPDVETQSQSSSNLNSRLLTPMSSRTGYAWSIASTRDDDSRPVSPTDLNKLGLSLSSNTDEFSSMFSDIVINKAILNITGENVSPHAISDKEAQQAQDHSSLPNSSKIGNFLSKLGEAEAPSDTGGAATPYNSTWQTMRRQLLRPVTTGTWEAGCEGLGGDPRLMAMIQWLAASASGRPRFFFFSNKEACVQELATVTSMLRSKFWTVGQLCRALTAFGKKSAEQREKCDLFTFLS